ncbi:MAG: HNH endonuclease [Enterococcus sp.]|nr:HNH endonuclease [Enterococcus sp.]
MMKYYKRLNDFMDGAKDFYFFNELGELYSYKKNKLKPLKLKNNNSNNNGSFIYMSIDNKTKSINKKTLINLYKIKNNKRYLFEENKQLELDLDIKTKEININELFQLSAFDERFKDYYYFNSDGKLYSAKRKYKELKLQKTNTYHIYSIDGKITSISPKYLRALYLGGFENAIEPIEGEEWKWIEGYEGTYKVSNCGRVVNFKGLREQFSNGSGYYQIILCKEGQKKTYTVHKLVAKHFVEGYKEGLVVNHKDLNKTNNHYTNLEWITPKENSIHYHQNKDKLIS